GLIERLAEHHGGQRGKRDAAATGALVTLRGAGSPHRRKEEDGVVENEVDTRLLQPARLEAGVMDDDTTTPQEIGQYNQRARRNGPVKDHQGGALTIRKLPGAHTVGGRRQPDGLDVEGEKTVPRKALFEVIERGRRETVEGVIGGRHTQNIFRPDSHKVKFTVKFTL